MKRLILVFSLLLLSESLLCTYASLRNEGDIVFRNEDVFFRKIDNHTWVGSGNKMFNESLYLVEGNERAILIDAGTDIKNLDKIVSSITSKPVTLIATHVHSDHTGPSINCFSEIWINPNDTVLIPFVMGNYKGKVNYLENGEILDLGGRKIEVVYNPGHTPGSTSFIDKKAGYGFSGDAFGSSLLLLTVDFSTFIDTCEKITAKMEAQGIKYLYPGHYYNNNEETIEKIREMQQLSKKVLSGEIESKPNTDNNFGLRLAVDGDGYRIIFNDSALK